MGCASPASINGQNSLIPQQQIDILLHTIQKNFLSDYQHQYNKQNINNIIQLFQQIYQINNRKNQQLLYQQLKNQIKSQQQLQMLSWFENTRSKKYNHNMNYTQSSTQIQNTKSNQINKKPKLIQNQQPQEQIKICRVSDKLIPYHQEQYQLKASLDNVSIGKFHYYISKVSVKDCRQKKDIGFFDNVFPYKIQKFYLLKKKKYQTINLTPWVYQKTQDGRYIWRGDIQLDKQDVANLLQFILAKRYQNDTVCPSILINAGSHGGKFGQNAAESNNRSLTDVNIYDETYDSVISLIKNGNLKLTRQNAERKIFINPLDSQHPCVYSKYADHIIDVQCSGALTPVKYRNPNTSQELILDFLYSQPRIKITNKSYQFYSAKYFFKDSSILQNINSQTAERLINLFQFKLIGAKLLYKGSQNQFKTTKFLQKFGLQTDVLFICLTNKDKTIGFYSNLSLGWNGQGQQIWDVYQKEREIVIDNAKKAFYFSLSNNHKFVVSEQKKSTIYRKKDKSYICLGDQQFVIVDESDKVDKNLVALNRSLYNENYMDQWSSLSCNKFNGNETRFFTTKQWQVWKINMEK